MSVATADSVMDILTRRASDECDRLAFGEAGRGGLGSTLTWGSLASRAAEFAAGLSDRGLTRGDVVLVALSTSTDLVAIILGVMRLGAVVALVPAPGDSPTKTASERVLAVAACASASLVISDHSSVKRLNRLGLNAMPAEQLRDPSGSDGRTFGSVDPDSVAYLQFSSGSTRSPSGIAISHSNLIACCRQARLRYRERTDDVAVTWVPLHHDMGLITGVFRPMFSGYASYLLAPSDFVAKPVRWLSAISELGGTLTSAPTFGYALCARKVTDEEMRDLTLTSLRVARVAAEPVRADVIRAFARRFAPVGFSWSSFCPSYGLAEATLTVTSAHPGAGPLIRRASRSALSEGRMEFHKNGTDVVSCGTPLSGTVVRIVNTRTHLAEPEGNVGEIWISGPQVARPYIGTSVDASCDFEASLADGTRARYVRTGDIGVHKGGQLYVLGRYKEILVVRGRNVLAQEIEQAAERSSEAVRPGRTAAFPLTGRYGEVAGLAAELRRNLAEDCAQVARRIRQEVAEQLGIRLCFLALVAPGVLPRTSSGKLRRRTLLELVLAGRLEAQYTWQAPELSLTVGLAGQTAAIWSPIEKPGAPG